MRINVWPRSMSMQLGRDALHFRVSKIMRPTLLFGLLLELGLLLALPLAAQQTPQTVSTKPEQTVQEKLGYPASARLLIIHADDFGMAHSVNRAISEALVQRWVTLVTLVVLCKWLKAVAKKPKDPT